MPEPTEIPLRRSDELVDIVEHWPVREREPLGAGKLFDFRADTVETPSGETMRRDYVNHTGAVAIIALDDDWNVVVVHQYRHPVGFRLVEPPAGLLDAEGESFLETARRELAEEAGLAASDWRILVDIVPTPGTVNESIRIFLAQGLSTADVPEGFLAEGEEAHMEVFRMPFDDVLGGILAGRLQSPTLVAGCLALAAARDDLDGLRPADAPWPARDAIRAVRDGGEEFGGGGA